MENNMTLNDPRISGGPLICMFFCNAVIAFFCMVYCWWNPDSINEYDCYAQPSNTTQNWCITHVVKPETTNSTCTDLGYETNVS